MFGFEGVLVQLLFKLVVALLAVVGVRFTLYWLDRHLPGWSFTEWMRKASSNDKALYFSARIIGVSLLVGLALS